MDTRGRKGAVGKMRTTVRATLVRNERRWLRIGAIQVGIHPVLAPEDRDRIGGCLELLEDLCVATQSVRQGMDVKVEVEPVSG